MKKQYNAFTLIELLIVMAVIVILMGIGLLGGRFVIKRAHKTEHQAILADVVKATEAYNLDNGKYPEIGIGSGQFYTYDELMRSYLDAGYLDHFSYGQPATFYYVDPANNSGGGGYYVCVSNTSDSYMVCDGPGAPSTTPTFTGTAGTDYIMSEPPQHLSP